MMNKDIIFVTSVFLQFVILANNIATDVFIIHQKYRDNV